MISNYKICSRVLARKYYVVHSSRYYLRKTTIGLVDRERESALGHNNNNCPDTPPPKTIYNTAPNTTHHLVLGEGLNFRIRTESKLGSKRKAQNPFPLPRGQISTYSTIAINAIIGENYMHE